MNKFIILAQRDENVKVLQKMLSKSWVESNRDSIIAEKVFSVVMADVGLTPDQQFDHIAGRIHDELRGEGQTLALVDFFDLSKANPMSSGWDATIAMLILALPEVRWVFGVLQGVPPSLELGINRWNLLKEFRYGQQAETLFDGSGLRNAVRMLIKEVKNDDGDPVAPYVPVRDATAAALDDEESYAYFNAYTAYRFGFRAFPVFRNVMAKALFAKETGDASLFKPLLTFEDVYISFPDNTQREHYSNLENRSALLGLLDHVTYRIFVTTAHRHVGDAEKHGQNSKYLASGRGIQHSRIPSRYWRVMLKPYSGMFALWSLSRLANRLRWTDGARRGYAPGFVWPPRICAGSREDKGHSAPGRLLQVATQMITRCEAILRSGVHTVQDASRCAVLATDALELLGDRTPTTAMDALKLKHMAEVTAECQFSGVEYHIEIKPRLKEIRKEARSLSRWFHHRRKVMAAMNAEMTTVIEIMRIFRDHGQFDESLICQNRIRYLHNRLWMCQNPMRIICWPLLQYIEVVLASFGWFLAAIMGWMFAFVALLKYVGKLPDKDSLSVGPWEQAFTAFTGFNNFNSTEFAWNFITAMAVMVGIAHIGIFISHIYMLVNRKD